MTKNIYYQTLVRRQNLFTNALYWFFFRVASYPRLILEVNIRKNFGERYFSLASAITVCCLMLFVPYAINNGMMTYHGRYYSNYDDGGIFTFWLHYGTWYIYTIWFMYQSWLRWQEVRRNPSAYNFGSFTLSTGDIDQRFFDLKIRGKLVTIRQIEILCEPALFFLAGIVLTVIGQKLGILFIVSSIFYSLSYAAAYKQGDDFMLDIIDGIILSQEMEKTMSNDERYVPGRGARWRMRMPTSEEMRQVTLGQIIQRDDEAGPAFAI